MTGVELSGIIMGSLMDNQRDPDSFDVRSSILNIADAVRLHRKLVLITCVSILVLVTLYLVIWPPVYEATAMVMVERDTDPVRDSFYLGWNVFRKDDARTEIELITSAPVLEAVVRREHLTYADVYHPFTSHLSYLWGKSLVGRAYRGVKHAILPTDSNAPSEKDLELARTIIDLRSGISISPIAESNVGRLTVKGPSRKVADIANAIVEIYLARRADRYHTEAEKAYEILSKEVRVTDEELQAVEARRLEFTRKHKLLAFDFQKENLEVSTLTDLEAKIDGTRSGIASMEASLGAIDAALANQPPTQVTSSVIQLNQLRQASKMKRLELETALELGRNRFREDAPEIQDIKNDIAKIDAMMAAEGADRVETTRTEGVNDLRQGLISRRESLRVDLSGAKAALAAMESDASRLRNRLTTIPALQAELRTLDRDYAMAQEKYREILSKQAQAAVSVATAKTTMSSMRLVEDAAPPAKKSWPKPKLLYPVALLVGLFLGVALALLRSYTDGRVRREHLEAMRGDLPLYPGISVAPTASPLRVVSASGQSGR